MKNECVEELKKTILPHALSFLNIEEFIDSWASNVVVIPKKDLKEELRAARESAAKDLGKDKLGYATARGVVFYIERLLGQNSSDDKDKKTISE